MVVSDRGFLPGRHPTPQSQLLPQLHGDLLCGWHNTLMNLPMFPAGSLWGAECLTESPPLLEGSQLGGLTLHTLPWPPGTPVSWLIPPCIPSSCQQLTPCAEVTLLVGPLRAPSLLKALGH